MTHGFKKKKISKKPIEIRLGVTRRLESYHLYLSTVSRKAVFDGGGEVHGVRTSLPRNFFNITLLLNVKI